MSAKTRINKELIFGKILPIAGFSTVVCGFAGGFGYLLWTTLPSNNIEDKLPMLHQHNTIPGDPGTYRLSGPDQVVTTQGDYKYTFNYEALQVLIEGKDKFQPIPFSTFSNPAMITDIKDKGCTLSASFVTASDNYLNAAPRSEDYQKYVTDSRAIAQAYMNDYCPATRRAPHVR